MPECLSFKDITTFVYFCEKRISSHQHLCHFVLLLIQFRAIVRYGKLAAPRFKDHTIFSLNDPDDNQVRCCQLTFNNSPISSLSSCLQLRARDLLLSGSFSDKFCLYLNTKISRTRNKRIIRILPEHITNPFCFPYWIERLLDLHFGLKVSSQTRPLYWVDLTIIQFGNLLPCAHILHISRLCSVN